MVHCEVVVLPCEKLDGMDRAGVVGKGVVVGVVKNFEGSVGMGACGVVKESEVESLVSPMGY